MSEVDQQQTQPNEDEEIVKVSVDIRDSEASIDLHGYYPDEICDIVANAAREAQRRGASTLRVIHGHGHDRRSYRLFVNSNTGPLGMAVRHALRDPALREWLYAKIDCSQWSWTTARVRVRRDRGAGEIEDHVSLMKEDD